MENICLLTFLRKTEAVEEPRGKMPAAFAYRYCRRFLFYPCALTAEHVEEGLPFAPFPPLFHQKQRYRCRQIPWFCDDVDWPVLQWEMLFDTEGTPLSGQAQEGSWFYTPDYLEGMYRFQRSV